MTRLRISAHILHTEMGRYKRYDKDLKAYTNTPMGERKCPICTDDTEDIIFCLSAQAIKSSGTHSLNTYQRHIKNSMKKTKRIKSSFSTQKISRQSTNLPNLSISYFKQNQKNRQTKYSKNPRIRTWIFSVSLNRFLYKWYLKQI